jgi:hypothetical protein
MTPELATPELSAGDVQLVTTLREQLSDELGRVRRHVTADKAMRLAGHIHEGVHIALVYEHREEIPMVPVDVEAWVLTAMLLLDEAKRIHTSYQPRNDNSLVPPDVTALEEVAA